MNSLNLDSGDGESELGLECLRAVPCLLLSRCLVTAGSIEIVEVPVKTAVRVCKALREDHPLSQGFIPQGFDGRVGPVAPPIGKTQLTALTRP